MMIAPSLNYVVQIVICRQITSFSREKETISEKCLRSSSLSLTTYLRANRGGVCVCMCVALHLVGLSWWLLALFYMCVYSYLWPAW